MPDTLPRLGFLGIASAVALLAASCGPRQPAVVTPPPVPPTPAATQPERAPYELALEVTPPAPKPGEAADMLLSLTSKAIGAPPKLKLAHEKLMHLIVVRRDLGSFQHLHPELQGDGKLSVKATFPTPGEYLVFADFTPEDDEQQVVRQTVTVQGSAPAAEALAPDADQPQVDGDVKAMLVTQPKPLVPAAQSVLAFRLTGAKSGKPIADLKPYLGAMGHAVILSADGQEYLHAHPLEDGGEAGPSGMEGMKGTEGMEHGAGSHGAAGHGRAVAPDPGTVTFHTEFPRPGLYKVWGQFNVGGTIRTVAFVVSVEAASPAAHDAK
jgi:hypothetical protein